jgi:hypothetical protein
MRNAALVVAGALAVAGASQASAETILTPWAGVVFSGDTPKTHGVYGGSLAFTQATGIGFEVDFGYSPDFFENDIGLGADSNLTTLMGNLMFSGAIGGNSRIYGTVGGGLQKSSVEGADDFFDVDRNDFGVNAGGGLILFFSEHVGVRGDARYFRSLQDIDVGDLAVSLGHFDFWRVYGGLSFAF